MGLKSRIRGVLERQLNKQYARTLAQRKKEISYKKYLEIQREAGNVIRVREEDKKTRNITLFVSKGGTLDPNAYAKLQVFFARHPECKILFGDEDQEEETPVLRSEFGREEWLERYTLGSVVAVDRSLEATIPEEIYFQNPMEIRGLLHSLIEKAGGFEKGQRAVRHIDEVLFHSQTDIAENEVENRAVLKAPVAPKTLQKLSVIIPTKDHPDILKLCLETLVKSSFAYPAEIVVVDNGSSPENKTKIEKLLANLSWETQYIYEPETFNFSRMCNRGAKHATGDVLLFLNDDMEMVENDWLTKMWEETEIPYVGATGCKLYYPNSKKIQHLGVQNLPGGPVHKYQFMEEKESPFLTGKKNVLAVTGACLMVRRECFEEANGFREELTVAYNDVALCMELHRLGYENVVLTDYYLYHHESLSRGNDLSREKLERLKRERNALYQAYPEYYGYDPYYHKNLSHELGDAKVLPRFFQVTEGKQVAKLQEITTFPMETEIQPEGELDFESGKGYCIFPFENNAIYNRTLILKKQGENSGYQIELAPQYSEKAAFWKQEQPNCAMSGFQVKEVLEKLPKGNYQVGFLLKSKLGKTYAFGWNKDYMK